MLESSLPFSVFLEGLVSLLAVAAVVWFVFGEGVFDWVSLDFSRDYVDERRGGPGHVWFLSVVLMCLL